MMDTLARRADISDTPAMQASELARLREFERLMRELLVGGHVTADGVVVLSVTMPVGEWQHAINLLSMTP